MDTKPQILVVDDKPEIAKVAGIITEEIPVDPGHKRLRSYRYVPTSIS